MSQDMQRTGNEELQAPSSHTQEQPHTQAKQQCEHTNPIEQMCSQMPCLYTHKLTSLTLKTFIPQPT